MKMKRSILTGLVLAFIAVAALYVGGFISLPGAAASASLLPVFGFAALSQDRDTQLRSGDLYSIGLAANAKLFAGGLGAINSSGYAVPASDTAGLKVVGRIEEQVDNTGGANGAKTVVMRGGVFKFAGANLTIADVGKPCFVTDDQTISVAPTNNSIFAGYIEAIESATEAWVRVDIAQSAERIIKKDRLSYKAVAVQVDAAAAAGSSAADADLVGGEILGCYPTGNQDQLADDVVLNADGSVTVTLAAAATANNTFKVVVLRKV